MTAKIPATVINSSISFDQQMSRLRAMLDSKLVPKVGVEPT